VCKYIIIVIALSLDIACIVNTFFVSFSTSITKYEFWIKFLSPPRTEEFVGESFPSTSISLYARKNKHAKRYEQFVVFYVRFVRQLFLDEL